MGSSPLAALVMAGGRSERMRAGGSGLHKALRLVRGVPLVERNLRALLSFGFDRLFVAVGAEERALASWLEARGRALAGARAATLEVLVEPRPLGTIGAVASLPGDVEHALVVNVDNLTSLDLGRLAAAHRERGAALTIAVHRQPFAVPFGVIDVRGERVVAYREKPTLRLPISSGTYVLHRRAIDRVPPGTRVDLPALVDDLLRAGEPVHAHPHEEPWIDVNDEAALAEAERLVGEHGALWPGAAAQEAS